MRPFQAYEVPFLGLKEGFHHFEFEVNDTFFSHFEFSQIEAAEIKVGMTLEKQSTMMILEFDLNGSVKSLCDRCGAPMDLEIEHQDRVIVKFGDETEMTEDEILVLGPAEHILHLEQYLYEFAHLGLPSKVAHEDEEDCDQDALDKLSEWEIGEDDDEENDPRWDALKGLK